ncbi:PA0069 family radical SAM protein [Candidatus Methylacidithermus pantelleriae]|uniref:DNA repair photolyase n=1 Tax=Candidatus Methylacidithermus pantelleriae TaxID=2744239 RepID=A0A8J2BUW1_9BACT|nr:PA0069 family radical SAM protein [Candidatus Methylacidithermus pantelleriae]CAF0702490.1 DNA repair photolyase [Candidatus Methylacidithermus pantelleriae]
MGRPRKARGACENPSPKFASYWPQEDPGETPDGPTLPKTRIHWLGAVSLFSYNHSPDLTFRVSLNPYRGCEHGCVYCYARPTHEYLGLSCGLDFETKIFVKREAPELLRRALASPRWRPDPIVLSGVTDPYQPVESRLRVTRRCLEVLAETRHPVVVVTKSRLITRDTDLLRELARHKAVGVWISLTTLDAKLASRLEPRASLPKARLEAIQALSAASIPVGVLVAPVIPGLTTFGLRELLGKAREAGACRAGYTLLRLPGKVRELFVSWLKTHMAQSEDRILLTVASCRNGQVNSSEFGVRLYGEGPVADLFGKLFSVLASKAGLTEEGFELSGEAFRRPALGNCEGEQLEWDWAEARRPLAREEL